MRRVMVSKREYLRNVEGGSWVVTDIGEALFHQFGCEYEEFQDGPGNYSVAIVEFPDGRVETFRPERIRFLDAQGERNAD